MPSFLTSLTLAAIIAALHAATGPARASASADLILTDGVLHAAREPTATALAIRDGKIVYVGDNAGACALAGPNARFVDLAGRLVSPGFRDRHMHPMSGGLRFLRCDLRLAASPSAVRDAVRACAAGGESWLVGYGLKMETLPAGFLTAAELDALSPDRPAMLATDDGRSAWVNSAAIGAAVLSGPGGVVAGEALARVRAAVPTPSQGNYRRALSMTLKAAARFGITSIVDASVSPAMLEAYVAAAKAGELTARITAAQRYDCGEGHGQIKAAARRARKIDDPFLRADAMKVFLDGEFDERSAALIDAYDDAPGVRGDLCAPPPEIDRAVRDMQRRGLQAHFHAMGDRAVKAALDALAAAAPAAELREQRHNIAHAGLVAPEDLPRFKALGVVASLQPFLLPADELEVEALTKTLGPERASRLYPFAALAHAEAEIAMGSDWPSPSMSPFANIGAALARSERGAGLSPSRLFSAYTRDARSGPGAIEENAVADIIVIDRDIRSGEASALADARVLLTLVGGREVWRDPALADAAACNEK